MVIKNQIVTKAKTDTIVQSNSVSSAAYDWTLVEKKIFCVILNQIYQMETLARKEYREIFIDSDLILTFDSSVLLNAVNHITSAYKALKGLAGRIIEIKTGSTWIALGFISYAEHNTDTRTIEIQISRKILPHILRLSREFTRYNLSTMLSFVSTYSQRFYELCQQYESKGFFYFSIDELRKMFGIKENQYKVYSNFIEKVIEKSQNELFESYQNGTSELFFKWSPDTYSRKGKKITTLNFSVINLEKTGRSYPDCLYQIRCELFEIFGNRKIMDSVDWWLTYNNLQAEVLLNRIVEIKNVYRGSTGIQNMIQTTLINQFQIDIH